MMILKCDLELADNPLIQAERSSSRQDHGREGFYLVFDGTRIEFYDEAVAELIAKAIAGRLGKILVPDPAMNRRDQRTECFWGDTPERYAGGMRRIREYKDWRIVGEFESDGLITVTLEKI